MTFGKPTPKYAGEGGVEQKEVDLIASRAFDAGVNLIDIANVYSGEQAEAIVG